MNRLITKKYFFKRTDTAENGMCIKVVCGVQGEHDELVDAIKNDDDVVFCGCEYVNEIDLNLVGHYEVIKREVVENEKN